MARYVYGTAEMMTGRARPRIGEAGRADDRPGAVTKDSREANVWIRADCPQGTERRCGNKAHRSSSTRSTESTISLISSRVTPGIMRSASVNERCRALSATRASCVETRGNSYVHSERISVSPKLYLRVHGWSKTHRCNGR